MTYVTWFLMLLPPSGDPAKAEFIKPFPDAVSCQVRVIELRDLEPGKPYVCKPIKGRADLSKPLAKKD